MKNSLNTLKATTVEFTVEISKDTKPRTGRVRSFQSKFLLTLQPRALIPGKNSPKISTILYAKIITETCTHIKILNLAWDGTDNWSLLHALKLSCKNEGK